MPRKFEPVEFEEPKTKGLRPLFTGRIANALDRVVEIASAIFFLAVVLGGWGSLAYDLVAIVGVLVAQSAWLKLSAIAAAALAVAFAIWRSSLISRLIIIAAVPIVLYATAPLLKRVFV
jgi:hypothetical protein